MLTFTLILFFFSYLSFLTLVLFAFMCVFSFSSKGDRALFLDFDAQAKPKGSFRRTDGTHWKETETR